MKHIKTVWLAFFALCLLGLSPVLYGQDDPMVKIVGRVLDVSTGDGLPNVNIFLAGTTLGVASSPDGTFVIRNIPRGAYELVVSMVGYERQVVPLRLFEAGDRELTVKLSPAAIQTATVEVTARDPVEWKEQFERFQREFLGETRNAKACTILNAEVMEFKEADGFFEVARDAPIVIENKALGYKLDLLVEEFRTDGLQLQYSAKPRFEELPPANDDEYQQWRENRKRAYLGSRKHFLTALARGTTYEEGFDVRSVPHLRLGTDFRRAVDMKKIIEDTQYDFQKKLVFPDYLEVTYRNESPEPTFQLALNAQGRVLGKQISWLKMNRLAVLFDTQGNLLEPFALLSAGYWAFERVADQLPLDYVPD